MHLEPLAARHSLRSRARICLPSTPVQASCPPIFSKSPSAMFYCRDAPPRRLLDTHSWHSARGRCMAAFDTRCRCFSTHLLERGSAVQRGRRRRRVGSRRDCVWTFLNFAPSAEGGVHDSGLKNQGKTANVTAIPKKVACGAKVFLRAAAKCGMSHGAAAGAAPKMLRKYRLCRPNSELALSADRIGSRVRSKKSSIYGAACAGL